MYSGMFRNPMGQQRGDMRDGHPGLYVTIHSMNDSRERIVGRYPVTQWAEHRRGQDRDDADHDSRP